jgi:polar amino acid transport system substrate-binding protein
VNSWAVGMAFAASLLAANALGLSATSGSAQLYSSSQAAAGNKLYDADCASCHGSALEGGVGPALSGQNLRTLAKNTKLTVGDLFQFMALQMPLNNPAGLKHDQYAEIMAYILKFNGYPAGSHLLTYDDAMKSSVPITSSR